MTDIEVPLVPGKLVAKQFERFLQQNGIEKPCNECGENSWGMHTMDQSNESPLVVARIMSANGVNWIPVYTLSCANCGIVKQFFTAAVEKWVDANG